MMTGMANWFQPHVGAALLGVVGVALVLAARTIQRRVMRWHHRLRRATRASSWLIRVTGWPHETVLILFGIMLAAGGLLLFLLTYPWDEI
jgi:hypothetical protein